MLIGPQRTGTTWMYQNLRHHPQLLFAPDKEIYFFNLLNQTHHRRYRSSSLRWYLEFFARELPRPDALRGEATSSYAAMDPALIANITLLNPRLKAIMLVRDPVERAWSQFKCMHRDHGLEQVSEEDFDRYHRDGYERRCNDFPALIDAWQARLEPGHLFVGAFHRIASEPQQLTDEIAAFLGIDPGLLDPCLLSKTVGASAHRAPLADFVTAVAEQYHDQRTALRARGLIR